MAAMAPRCERVMERGTGRWWVENQTSHVKIEVESEKDCVYISKCKEGGIVEIVGKCNSITLDNCQRTKVQFDSIISTFEIINCKKVWMGVKEVCPAVSIDKSDGVIVYLFDHTNPPEFIQSKSSEMNVQWVDPATEDLVERVIPEQFKHNIVDGQITTSVSDLYTT